MTQHSEEMAPAYDWDDGDGDGEDPTVYPVKFELDYTSGPEPD